MKTLTKLALAAVMLVAAVSAKADWVNGYFRSNGTNIMPYYRTPANGIPHDNLSYRGSTSQQPGYISPRHYGVDTTFSTLPNYDFWPSRRSGIDCFPHPFRLQTLPNLNRTYKIRDYDF